MTSSTAVPANPSADNSAKKVYQWLSTLPDSTGKKLISGVFGGYSNIGGDSGFSLAQGNAIKSATGKFPAIYGADYARGWDVSSPGDEASLIDHSCNSDLISHWKNGGLVAISHHLPNPVYAGNNPGNGEGGLKHAISNDEFATILQDGSAARQRWLALLDKVAQGLQELRDNGVPVLYRPLHEMNGEWFWWGATGYNTDDSTRQDLYRRLYQDVFSYFVNTKGLTNLLWVFSPDANRDHKTAYYPGAGYVDIAGLDFYADNPATLSGYDEMLGLNKPFGLVEVGPSTTNGQYDYASLVNTILQNFPKTIVFVPWNDGWSPVKNQNASAAFNNGSVINLGDISISW